MCRIAACTWWVSSGGGSCFDEPGAGNVALVALFRHGSRPRVEAEPVAFWKWKDVRCRDMNELRSLLTTPNLDRHVVRLHLDMTVSLAEESEDVSRAIHHGDGAVGRNLGRARGGLGDDGDHVIRGHLTKTRKGLRGQHHRHADRTAKT